MAITKVRGGFFDPEHSAGHKAFGFGASAGSGAPVPAGATAPRRSGAPTPMGMGMHGMDRVPDASEVAHQPRVMRAQWGALNDLAQDKAMVRKGIDQHDAQLHGGAHTALKLKQGGMVRLPRAMKPKVAQSHSPIAPNNTAPRKPQVTRTPSNAMPGGVMPYGTMPSDEGGYEATSPTGATQPMLKRGGRVRP